jgi:DNA-binding NarL/FixJ family response regulator
MRFEQARTLLALGRAQRLRHRWAGARDALERSLSEFAAMGSPPWAAQAAAELKRVGGRRRAGGQLTPAEQQVAELAADGRANKEIAAELHITVHTVEAHLSHAYAKLGVRARTQLAARLAPGHDAAKDCGIPPFRATGGLRRFQ